MTEPGRDIGVTGIVVGAAIVRTGRLLAQQRAFPPSVAGQWELPGGRVEPGESEPAALIRECLEELGVRVRVGALLGPAVPLKHGLVLKAYTAELDPADASPHPREHLALRWLTLSTVDEVNWLAADHVLLPALRAVLADAGQA
jgi:8-oxo-dGTP diphosphatase